MPAAERVDDALAAAVRVPADADALTLARAERDAAGDAVADALSVTRALVTVRVPVAAADGVALPDAHTDAVLDAVALVDAVALALGGAEKETVPALVALALGGAENDTVPALVALCDAEPESDLRAAPVTLAVGTAMAVTSVLVGVTPDVDVNDRGLADRVTLGVKVTGSADAPALGDRCAVADAPREALGTREALATHDADAFADRDADTHADRVASEVLEGWLAEAHAVPDVDGVTEAHADVLLVNDELRDSDAVAHDVIEALADLVSSGVTTVPVGDTDVELDSLGDLVAEAVTAPDRVSVAETRAVSDMEAEPEWLVLPRLDLETDDDLEIVLEGLAVDVAERELFPDRDGHDEGETPVGVGVYVVDSLADADETLEGVAVALLVAVAEAVADDEAVALALAVSEATAESVGTADDVELDVLVAELDELCDPREESVASCVELTVDDAEGDDVPESWLAVASEEMVARSDARAVSDAKAEKVALIDATGAAESTAVAVL